LRLRWVLAGLLSIGASGDEPAFLMPTAGGRGTSSAVAATSVDCDADTSSTLPQGVHLAFAGAPQTEMAVSFFTCGPAAAAPLVRASDRTGGTVKYASILFMSRANRMNTPMRRQGDVTPKCRTCVVINLLRSIGVRPRLFLPICFTPIWHLSCPHLSCPIESLTAVLSCLLGLTSFCHKRI